jgi:hypothetical protein
MNSIQKLEMYASIKLRRRCESRIMIGEEAMQMGVRLRCLKWRASVFVVSKFQNLLPENFH